MHNIGIQMKQEELTKAFMILLNWKDPLVSMVYTNYFSTSRVNMTAYS